jgi:hypothetical protein
MFGKGDNKYPGLYAMEDIGKNEVMIKVSSKYIINTRKAFYSELSEIYFDHPELFGKGNIDGEDMILYAFMLREI